MRERLCNHYTSLPLIVAFGKRPDNALSYTYTTWLLNWRSYMTDASYRVMFPPEAAVVSTPLQPHNWFELLSTFPNQDLKEFFINGLLHGFKIGFKNPLSQLRSSKKNLLGALQHPQVVDDYLQAEIAEHRVIGPFQMEDILAAHISRFGVIPKHHSLNKWRLIVDLSHPVDFSINDDIPKDLCSLTYITVDTVINHIMELGPETLLAKIDIKSAFRLLPVHPSDRHLLAMKWNKGIYIDSCLPFGLRSAPKLFNILADLFLWILQQQAGSPTIHYLDDYLTMEPAGEPNCYHNLHTMIAIARHLGIG